MIILPAIDIRKQNVVRLFRGLYSKETIYSNDPVAVAKKWQQQGAEFLHIIDLEGAFWGVPKNLEVVKDILSQVKLKVHLGGGLRSRDDIKKVLDCGVHRVILSTKVFEDAQFLLNLGAELLKKIIVSIDIKAGLVLDRGWTEPTSVLLKDAVKKIEDAGIQLAVITDISSDGTLAGLNAGMLTDVLSSTKMNIIAAGGIASIDDVKTLKQLELKHANLFGVIIGKALYEDKINLKEAIQLCQDPVQN